jgi:DNA mismatch endonuclease (patch repair protein)
MNNEGERSDNLTPEQRKRTMKRVRSKDTAPEMVVRRLVHSLGARYRLHGRGLPGAPDLVFARRRKVIFVHGCFWHGHDCPSGQKRPKTNADYWTRKLQRTLSRDAVNQTKLWEEGWSVLVIWECELKQRQILAERLKCFLDIQV